MLWVGAVAHLNSFGAIFVLNNPVSISEAGTAEIVLIRENVAKSEEIDFRI